MRVEPIKCRLFAGNSPDENNRVPVAVKCPDTRMDGFLFMGDPDPSEKRVQVYVDFDKPVLPEGNLICIASNGLSNVDYVVNHKNSRFMDERVVTCVNYDSGAMEWETPSIPLLKSKEK